MPRVERVPGRRKAEAQQSARPTEQPARSRARGGAHLAGDEQAPPSRQGVRTATTARVSWLLGLSGAAGALIATHYVETDTVVEQSVAAALGVLLAIGFAVRSGGRALSAAAISVLVGAGAVATQSPTLLAGAAIGTGVLAACLAVLGTTPARSFATAVREVVVAQLVATAGALGVAGFRVDIDPDRFGYTVLALSLAAAVALVYRLGGGLHGLGRGGVLLFAAALALLVVGLVYTAALARWGSPEVRLDIDTVRQWLLDHVGGVPHPVVVLLGVPALVWGVSMRARRRQGWWVCVFGTTATAAATTRLIQDDETARQIALGATYSVVLGLLVGFLLIRAVRLFRGTPGRRAARDPQRSRRAEPARLDPLH